jgi:hypothetical protein
MMMMMMTIIIGHEHVWRKIGGGTVEGARGKKSILSEKV